MSDPPLPPKPRLLILCFDGTTNQYSSTNTNVIRLYSLLAKNRPYEQITYYQAGIGTYFNPGVVSPMFDWFAKILDEAIAWYLDAHVRDGYRFLMQNYCTGDKICLFGFSRGAYTARALAGFLFKIGLLPRDNEEQIPFAYKLYKRTDKQGVELSAGFKQTFCRSVTVDFVGVWDTVASVGVIYRRSLPFTNSNTAIKTFRHALSLDERRVKFQPNLYHRTSTSGNSGLRPEHVSLVATETATRESPKSSKAMRNGFPRFLFKKKPKSNERTVAPLSLPSTSKAPDSPSASSQDCVGCDLLEVWFVGCHSDVGGGEVADNITVSLADICLRWMIRQVILCEVGILFDPDALLREDIDITAISQVAAHQTNDTTVTPTPPGRATINEPPNTVSGEAPKSKERQQIDADALTPLHDELKLNPLWWILEVFPAQYSWQDADGKWHHKWGFNLGKGRVIREDHPKFHITVKERMGDATLKYSPNATWIKGQEIYYD